MPQVSLTAHTSGDFSVDDAEKVFEDSKAQGSEKSLATFQALAFDVLLYRPDDASILQTWTL